MRNSTSQGCALHLHPAGFVFSGLTAVEEPVQLTSGQVSGVELDSDVTVYRGIPFAAPPVGERRWIAPEPPIPWQGVRAAETFAPACMQRQRGRAQQLMSEDCLYLNVWTKAESNQDSLP